MLFRHKLRKRRERITSPRRDSHVSITGQHCQAMSDYISILSLLAKECAFDACSQIWGACLTFKLYFWVFCCFCCSPSGAATHFAVWGSLALNLRGLQTKLTFLALDSGARLMRLTHIVLVLGGQALRLSNTTPARCSLTRHGVGCLYHCFSLFRGVTLSIYLSSALLWWSNLLGLLLTS